MIHSTPSLTAYISTWRRWRVESWGAPPVDLDEGHQLAINAQPVVGELALDLVLGGQVGVLVKAEAVAEKVSDQQAGIALVGITGDQIGQRLTCPRAPPL